jgi:hypothetical protein
VALIDGLNRKRAMSESEYTQLLLKHGLAELALSEIEWRKRSKLGGTDAAESTTADTQPAGDDNPPVPPLEAPKNRKRAAQRYQQPQARQRGTQAAPRRRRPTLQAPLPQTPTMNDTDVHIRTYPEEKQQIRKRAAYHGMTISDYTRRLWEIEPRLELLNQISPQRNVRTYDSD